MNIHQLRQKIGQEIIDYNQLKDALKGYVHPRGKISEWLSKGELIRVKKGLYVFSTSASREAYSLEILANLTYGPSAISLHYALYYYGLIPERVQTITSITNKRKKQFTTPVGRFTYQYLSSEKFSVGIQFLTSQDHLNFLIATPEKALCDIVALTLQKIRFKTEDDVEKWMIEDLRFDFSMIKKFDPKLLTEITYVYHVPHLTQFINLLLQRINNNE